jgi:hypothetical protein
MKTLIISTLLLLSSFTYSAQFVAELQLEEPVEGICNMKHVYSLFPSFEGQEEAIPLISEEQVLKRLNEIVFLQEHPRYKSKGTVSLLINCKGEVVLCEMDTKTKSKVLDNEIVSVFNALGKWKAGKLDGNDVDSARLYSFKIKNGVVSFE